MELEVALEKIYPKILNFVSSQARSEKEITDRLARYSKVVGISLEQERQLKGFILTRLKEENIINDQNYANDFVFSIINSTKPRGAGYIKRFLFKKGISELIINSAISKIDPDEEFNSALNGAKKKLPQLKGKNKYEIKQKLWRHLALRGFSSDIIGRVIDAVYGVE